MRNQTDRGPFLVLDEAIRLPDDDFAVDWSMPDERHVDRSAGHDDRALARR